LSEEKKLPVSATLTVLKSKTLYKTSKWWCALLLLESYGRKQVAVYLWVKKTEQWKRKMKYVVYNKRDWQLLKDVAEEFIQQLP
jgi:hypothetical protein